MFLTLKNEKTLKKMRSKTLKNNIFFILGRNLIIRSFEIPHSIWKLHKDFKSVFVFKFRQKTKKFTPKWQKPLFEKRVTWVHIVKTVYKRIFACKLTNNICVIILVRCCGPHLLFATRLHTSCLGWCRSVRRRTHHVTPRRTRVWRVRRWTTPSQY